ncbi:MAG: NfeD family protein [Pirellulales bacterium]
MDSFRWLLGLASLYVLLAKAAYLRAQDEPKAAAADAKAENEPASGKKRLGRLVRIGLPIESGDDARIRSQIERAIEPLAEQTPRHVLVLEFYVKPNAERDRQEEYAQTSQFGPAYELAKYLSELSRVQKIAYVPTLATGHAVLVAMACDEIHMAADAVIGAAGVAEEGVVDPVRRSGYNVIFERRRTIPLAIALGMLDSNLVVYRVETDAGRDFVLAEDLPEFRKTHLVKGEPTAIIQRGQFGKFTGTEGRNLGFVKFLPRSREHLAAELELDAESLEEDPSLGDVWRTLLVRLEGTISQQLASKAIINIRREIAERDVNFVCVRIDSGGGSPADSEPLANYLASLDPGKVRTVAYIGSEARADAALVALACDHVVMQSGAKLGGEADYKIEKREIELVREAVRTSLAPDKGRNWSLVASLIDPDIEIYRYTRQGERDVLVEYFSPEEAAEREDRDGQEWKRGEAIKPRGAPLEVDAALARQLHLANHVVEDFNQFKAIYNITDDLVEPQSNWATDLVEALAHPGLAWLLLAVGFGAMYIELHTPGLGVAGFISGMCFMVYFWSQFLTGTAQWLEVLLFFGGVLCVMLEILVLPGFGVFGFGGAVMILSSLVLASQTFIWPDSAYQMSEFRDSLMVVGLGIAGCIGMAVALRKVLPRAPFLGRVVLMPPEGDAAADIRQREAVVDLGFLVGQRGVMTTPCSPAGIARFDDELIHVVSDGDFIARGADVIVSEAHGNRVVVRVADRD